jgi:hypothetical protein
MKKLLVVAVAVALASLASANLRAEEGSELEISGNVITISGWEKANTNGSSRTLPVRGGILGDDLAAFGANGVSTFGFFVDQIEVDLAKSFGENIRVRADLDFNPGIQGGPGQVALFGGTGDILVEQGYVTANIPAGNGVELLVGRFNSGIGFDPVDRNLLKTVSFSMPHRVILPHNLTGARFAYDFNENTRWEVFIVNDMGDQFVGATSAVPSFGTNVIYKWGEEGSKSWVKLSGVGGPELATKIDWSMLGDMSASFTVTDAFKVGAEGFYRQDNQPFGVIAEKNVGGQLNGTYNFTDVWDGTLRYSFVWDVNGDVGTGQVVNENVGSPGLGLGTPARNHEVTVATGYQITDGARFVFEGRVDIAQVSNSATPVGFGYGVGGMFAYSF